MSGNQAVNINFSDHQCFMHTSEVTLILDHLESDNHEGLGIAELRDKFKDATGQKVVFTINNSASPEEQALFKFFREHMKKKQFEPIVTRALEILQAHPSSVWAHCFYGIACKKIPDKERYFVPAITAAVSINPNFLDGWKALYQHFLSIGGFFSKQVHHEMCIVVKALLKLEPDFDSWCTIVGHIWDYVEANDVDHNQILSLLEPYLKCACAERQVVAASVVINLIRVKKTLLPKEFSNQVLSSFQVLIMQKESEVYKMGLLHAALMYFNRRNDLIQICHLLNFIYVNGVMGWNSKSAKEMAYNLIYELFRTLGDDALETIAILRNACGEDMLTNKRYFLCNTVFDLTNSYSSLLENVNSRLGNLQTWGRLLYLKVLVQLKLYQEAYEQILVDLHCSSGSKPVEKIYMGMLIEIFSHAMDPPLQLFTLKLGYKYLQMYGHDVKVLCCMCVVCISVKDKDTARDILKLLMSLGALDDVIYLQALIEDDNEVKLDFLKSLENIPEAKLLSAVIYKELGKSKRVLKSMLEASFHVHAGISPFEWLGIYYYERDTVVKATRYFLEAFSYYLVSCISVNYIISIYSKDGDIIKAREFIETLSSRNAITTDVACNGNLKAGLNYMTQAKETMDFHRALEKFRKVTDFSFERKIIEMVADSLGYFGMHGSAADFYLMCHAESNTVHVYPSVLYGSETKMIKGKGFRYLNVVRNVAQKATKSPLALFTYGCALFDRAVASYSTKNFGHCAFLCQQAILVLSRCVALYSTAATFWISLGNVLFTVSSLHSGLGSVYVPSWLIARDGQVHTMVLVKKHEPFVLALRCYAVAMELCKTEEMRKLVAFYIGISFRYAKTVYKEIGGRMLFWGLMYALESCDLQCWQRNNLCGVILTGLDEYRDALEFFKDSMLIGAREDARDAEFNSGLVYLRLGEFINAQEVFMHRRGNDPMDSLVWRSYMLLHHCLGDSATVLHYLWYLIYSIRHYPSLEQGMEYLQLICSSSSEKDTKLDQLKKKCLLYAIFQTPMFMKRAFVGDCEVPHKFNDVTAHNYFFHGKYHAALGDHITAEENLHEFLKLVAVNKTSKSDDINQTLFTLAMSSRSPMSSLHDMLTTDQLLPETALVKFCSLQAIGDRTATNRLLAEFPKLGSKCDLVFMNLFATCKLAFDDISLLPPTLKNLYAAFISRSLVQHLVGTPSTDCGIQPSPCRKQTLDEIINDISGIEERHSSFLNQHVIVSLLKEELFDKINLGRVRVD